MKKGNKILKAIAKASLISAKQASAGPSLLDFYQPKEPKDLARKLAKLSK